MVMMVMVMVVMVMVMVLVMVMVMLMVPKALSQAGWLHQRQCQSINRLKHSIGQASTNSEFKRLKDSSGNATPAEARLSQARL